MRTGLPGDDLRLLRQKHRPDCAAPTVQSVGSWDNVGRGDRDRRTAGVELPPLSLELDELGALKLPCILHWEFNHFVVLVSVKGHRAVLHDPARGRRAVSLTELSRSFTGVALEAGPAAPSLPTASATAFTCVR